MYIDLPDPRPLSNNVDLETVWYKEIKETTPGVASVTSGIKDNVGEATLANVQPASFVAPAPVAAAPVPATEIPTNPPVGAPQVSMV